MKYVMRNDRRVGWGGKTGLPGIGFHLTNDGHYDIKNVVAADEWAENVDNNAFTNAAARATTPRMPVQPIMKICLAGGRGRPWCRM